MFSIQLLRSCRLFANQSVCFTYGYSYSTPTEFLSHFRLKRVGEEYSNLMEKAGVDTVKELRNRIAANLYAKIVEVNGDGLIVDRVPPFSIVES